MTDTKRTTRVFMVTVENPGPSFNPHDLLMPIECEKSTVVEQQRPEEFRRFIVAGVAWQRSGFNDAKLPNLTAAADALFRG